MAEIQLVCGDILTMAADALVCPAHKHLIRGRGLSAQIYDCAGEPLLRECAGQDECAVGEARLTQAHNLPVTYLLHTVTPQWTSGDQWGAEALRQLRRCYQSVLELALANDIRSLLFPALSAGTNRMPHAIAAHQGLDVLHMYRDRFEALTVCLRSESALHEWRKIGQRFQLTG